MTFTRTVQANQQKRIARYKIEALKYYRGKGKPLDYTQALHVYKLAAKMGDAEAQFITGGMIYKGQGMKPDCIQVFLMAVKNC